MMLGRTIVLAGGEDVSLIRPRWYTRIFVGADIFTLVLQGLGMSTSSALTLIDQCTNYPLQAHPSWAPCN